jgi:hypothetical protein
LKIVLTSLSAFANPIAEESERTVVKAALSTEIASAEGVGAKLLTELTACGMVVKQARYKFVHHNVTYISRKDHFWGLTSCKSLGLY